MEVKDQEIYTASETQNLLKISESTFMRLVKKGILKAAKVGGQYRILGRDILHLVSPALEERARGVFQVVKEKIKSLEE